MGRLTGDLAQRGTYREWRLLPPPVAVLPLVPAVILLLAPRTALSAWPLPAKALLLAAVILSVEIMIFRRIELDRRQLAVRSLCWISDWTVEVREIRLARPVKVPYIVAAFRNSKFRGDEAFASRYVELILRDRPPRRLAVDDPDEFVAILKPLLWDGDKPTQRLADRWESTLLDE